MHCGSSARCDGLTDFFGALDFGAPIATQRGGTIAGRARNNIASKAAFISAISIKIIIMNSPCK